MPRDSVEQVENEILKIYLEQKQHLAQNLGSDLTYDFHSLEKKNGSFSVETIYMGETVKDRVDISSYGNITDIEGDVPTISDLKYISERLELFEEVKDFGRSLGLKVDETFKPFEFNYYMELKRTGNGPCNWIYIADPLKIESALNNGQEYIYNSDVETLKAIQVNAEELGFDTWIYTAEAFGNGGCPITPEMLEAKATRLAFLILHESFHTTVKHLQTSYVLEESMGDIIGHNGALTFFEKEYGKESSEYSDAVKYLEKSEVNKTALEETISSLNSLYDSDLPPEEKFVKKETIFAASEYDFDDDPRNNAFLLCHTTHSDYVPLARSAYEKAGSIERVMDIYMMAAAMGQNGVDFLENYTNDNASLTIL